jgi:hypothetical protein
VDEETFQQCRRIGDAAALLVAYVALGFANRSGDSFLGAVNLTDRSAAGLLRAGVAAVRRWRRRLLEEGLIEAKRTGRGYRVVVCDSDILANLLFALRADY